MLIPQKKDGNVELRGSPVVRQRCSEHRGHTFQPPISPLEARLWIGIFWLCCSNMVIPEYSMAPKVEQYNIPSLECVRIIPSVSWMNQPKGEYNHHHPIQHSVEIDSWCFWPHTKPWWQSDLSMHFQELNISFFNHHWKSWLDMKIGSFFYKESLPFWISKYGYESKPYITKYVYESKPYITKYGYESSHPTQIRYPNSLLQNGCVAFWNSPLFVPRMVTT